MNRRALLAGLAGLAIALFASCDKSMPTGTLMPDEQPVIRLSTLPAPGDSVFYIVQFTWFSFDPDGQVVGFRYVVDPPVEGDTAWIYTTDHSLVLKFRSTTPGPPGIGGIFGTGYHVFAIEAVDDRGLSSSPASDAFTSVTVAPTARIVYPSPNRLATAATPTSVLLRWTGTDPDGAGDKRPVKYKYKLEDQPTIQRALGLGSVIPNPTELQGYFGKDGPGYATWDSTGADSTFKEYDYLTPGRTYFFAVVAFDDAGASDPRFDLDRNLIRFRPSTEQLGPRLTVSNDLIVATGTSLDFSESRVAHVAIPAGEVITFNWQATPPPGGTVAGYRWVLDPVNGDISDETPRADESQTYRWSGWALESRSATVGPFAGSPAGDELHRIYVEARDNSGNMSDVVIEIAVIYRARPLLVIDDVQGPPDFNYGPSSPYSYQPYGNFPTEAVLDTLLYAVGGKPYQHRPPGTLSKPGVFAGFDYDTLDYRFHRVQGLPIDVLFRYQAVAIYTTIRDATTIVGPLSGLRYAAWRQSPNPLASYVAHGGKVWLFGDGILYAFLLKPGDSPIQMPRVPPAGSFPYDFMKLRAFFAFGGGSSNPNNSLTGAVPYLTDHATPGRPWPPDTVRSYARGSCDDPRVGPASFRNHPRWDGLPCLGMSREFPDWPSGFPTSVPFVAYVGTANAILEDLDPSLGVRIGSALDTLYLYRSMDYFGSNRPTIPDGKPVMCAYEGADYGPIVWTSLPLWMFDRQELRTLAATVLGSFGITPVASPSQWSGPGSANETGSPAALSADARSSPRVVRRR